LQHQLAFIFGYNQIEKSMSKNLQLNIYLKRNNRACMVFKRNGILYRINNLTFAKEFVYNMQDLSKAVAKGEMKEDSYLELHDHRAKIWVLECTLLKGMVALKLWFQSKSSGEHLDVRFSWEGTDEEFMSAVHYLAVAADVQRIFRVYKK
jgi:hypothetical protein